MSCRLPRCHAFTIASMLILLSELLLALPSYAQATRNTPPAPAVLGPLPARPAAGLAPSVQSISPSVLSAGSTYEILIAGSNLNPRAVFSLGDGIEAIGAPQAAGRGQLRLAVRVLPSAMPGVRVVRVTTGNLSGQGPATLSIVAAQERRSAAPPAAIGPSTGTGTMLPPPPPLLPPGMDRRAAPPPKPAQPIQAGAQPALGQLPPSASAATQPFQFTAVKLAFGVIMPDTTKPAWAEAERNFNELSTQVVLIWETPNPAAYQWRWQIADKAFPSGFNPQPAGLLDEGDAYFDHFKLNLAAHIPAWAKAAQPATGEKKKIFKKKGPPAQPDPVIAEKEMPPAVIDSSQPLPLPAAQAKLHIRLVAFKDGKPTGTVSNAVVAHYVPPKPLEEEFAPLAEASKNKYEAEQWASKAADSFDLKILSFQRAVFPDPNLWGCVVVANNPYAQKALHPLQGYSPGEYCPPNDPKYQQKGWFDKYVIGSIEGWAMGWDKLSGYYNGAKAWIASEIADEVPCEWLGKKLEKECKGAVEQMVGAAISAGLVAVGLPPSLPNLEALSEAGKGHIADAATEFTCQTYESNGGTCTPEMREQLKKYYKKGLDELQKQLETHMKHEAHEPGCGDAAAAAEHGKVPLPCFSDYPGVSVKPAKGAVYEPPLVKVRVTPQKVTPPKVGGCDIVNVSLFLTNKVKGGYLGGKNLPPANVSGWAYLPTGSTIPALAVGKSVDMTLILSKMAPVDVPGNYIPHFHFDNWKVLYWGGKGTLSADISHAVVNTGKPGGVASVSCAKGDSWPVQIPQ